jgi:hypothetical protein
MHHSDLNSSPLFHVMPPSRADTQPHRLDDALLSQSSVAQGQRRKAVAVALLVSIVVHTVSVTVIGWGESLGLLSNSAVSDSAQDTVFEAQLLPAESKALIPIPAEAATPDTLKTPTPKLARSTPKLADPQPAAPQSAPTLAEPIDLKPLVLPPTPNAIADSVLPLEPASTSVPQPEATPPEAQLTEAPSTTVATAILPVSHTIQPSPNSFPPISSDKFTYTLPKTATVTYDLTVRKSGMSVSGKAILNFTKTDSDLAAGVNAKYVSDLTASATLFFKKHEARYGSEGQLTPFGLRPLIVEEKRPKGSMIRTTIEPDNGRVIISGKEGFLPYYPNAIDYLGMIVQLAINQQIEARWRVPGTVQDFKIYRANGITDWRLQSQGMTTITVADRTIETLYIKRIPLDDKVDYDDVQHFWLDPAHYGFPVKIHWDQQDGAAFDIVMSNWQEH